MKELSPEVRSYMGSLGKVGGSRNTKAQTEARKRSVQIMNQKKNASFKAKKAKYA